MYEIDYYVDGESKNYHVKSNHLPRSDDNVIINGKNYQVIDVKHVLNTVQSTLKAWDANTLDEKFIVTLHEKEIKF